MNVTTNCPHCDQHISMEVPGDPPPLINLLSTVHCAPCDKLLSSRRRTKERIDSLCERIRHSTDSAEIERLTGGLKAQYSSQKMLAGKFAKRRSTTDEKVSIDKPVPTSLPW